MTKLLLSTLLLLLGCNFVTPVEARITGGRGRITTRAISRKPARRARANRTTRPAARAARSQSLPARHRRRGRQQTVTRRRSPQTRRNTSTARRRIGRGATRTRSRVVARRTAAKSRRRGNARRATPKPKARRRTTRATRRGTKANRSNRAPRLPRALPAFDRIENNSIYQLQVENQRGPRCGAHTASNAAALNLVIMEAIEAIRRGDVSHISSAAIDNYARGFRRRLSDQYGEGMLEDTGDGVRCDRVQEMGAVLDVSNFNVLFPQSERGSLVAAVCRPISGDLRDLSLADFLPILRQEVINHFSLNVGGHFVLLTLVDLHQIGIDKKFYIYTDSANAPFRVRREILALYTSVLDNL